MTESHPQRRIYSFDLFADYFQFCIEDDGDLPDPPEQFWAGSAIDDMIDASPRSIRVGTVRNMMVSVTLEILENAPEDDLSGWDQVTEASLDVLSGRIIVAGNTDYRPDAARISVPPGIYRLRAYFGHLDSVDKETGLEGDDYYRIVLWPGNVQPVHVLKRWPKPWLKNDESPNSPRGKGAGG